MTDSEYSLLVPGEGALDFFWECFGPTACTSCKQNFWRDQAEFFKHSRSGRLYIRCVHCGTFHRFGLTLAP